jgi:hypothetical protein
MAVVDDLRAAVAGAISAGSAAARGQGAALGADFENLVRPNLEAIVVQAASITDAFAAGRIGSGQARDDLQTQLDNVEPIILAAAELAVLAVQVIINAVIDALTGAVNAATSHAVGIALL